MRLRRFSGPRNGTHSMLLGANNSSVNIRGLGLTQRLRRAGALPTLRSGGAVRFAALVHSGSGAISVSAGDQHPGAYHASFSSISILVIGREESILFAFPTSCNCQRVFAPPAQGHVAGSLELERFWDCGRAGGAACRALTPGSGQLLPEVGCAAGAYWAV